MNAILDYIRKHGGYARLTDLRDQRFQTRDITVLCQRGELEKVQPGLYKLTDSDVTSGRELSSPVTSMTPQTTSEKILERETQLRDELDRIIPVLVQKYNTEKFTS